MTGPDDTMRSPRPLAQGRDEPPSDAPPPSDRPPSDGSQPGGSPLAGRPSDREPPQRGLRSWETLVERRIREAMDSGAFDELPFRGERLPPDDDGAWSVAGRLMRREGAAPPWIETDKSIRRLLEERDAVLRRAPRSSPFGRRRDREAIVRIVGEVNALALRLEQEAPTPAQHRRRLDLAAELERLEAAAEGHPPGRGGADPP